MTIHPLPPQAYTKDTLIKAYEWLQAQGESIKQIATSPDVLVSLYMKAQMQGEEVLHRPSIKNFKSDLKNLASMMGEWGPSISHSQRQSPLFHASSHLSESAVGGKTPQSPSPPSASVGEHHTETRVSNSVSIKTEPSIWDEGLQIKLKEIQNLYHLSTELEAAKLLMSIGYHHAKRLMS